MSAPLCAQYNFAQRMRAGEMYPSERDDEFFAMTHDEIAAELGWSRQLVQLIEAQAIAKLRAAFGVTDVRHTLRAIAESHRAPYRWRRAAEWSEEESRKGENGKSAARGKNGRFR